MMSFTAWLHLDSVFTPFAMRPSHSIVTATLNHRSSPNCDLNAADDDVQDEQLLNMSERSLLSLHTSPGGPPPQEICSLVLTGRIS
eukprot:1160774-Pelagomonas_calceolata.AAC.7